MYRRILASVIAICIMLACTGCAAMITMPYSSQEYENSGWSVTELVSHFKDLGFQNINTTNITRTFDESLAGDYWVKIEDSSADSWFTEYRQFEKGESFTEKYEIYISGFDYTPTLNKDTSSAFSDLIDTDRTPQELENAVTAFMREHNGEYLEFDGVLTTWDDEHFWVGIWFTVAVEGNTELAFSWEDISTLELEEAGSFSHTMYKQGVVCTGDQVHMVVKINSYNNGWELEIQKLYIE